MNPIESAIFRNLIGFNKMKKKIIGLSVIGFAVLLLSGCSLGSRADKDAENTVNPKFDQMQKQNDAANPDAGGARNEKEKQSIPAKVLEACSGKSEGDACEASSPQGSDTQTGTCKKMGDASRLVCLPANMPARPDGDRRGSGPAPSQGAQTQQ